MPVPPENMEIKAPNNFVHREQSKDAIENNNYKQHIIRLNSLIQSNKNNFFGSSSGKEIIKLIEALSPTKENAEYLLTTYSQLYGTGLIDDLKRLTSNYDSIKEYCKKFIDHGIISKNYPHERLT